MRLPLSNFVCFLITILLSSFSVPLIRAARAEAPATQPAIAWQPWSDDVFDRAKKENKFVLMDLQAIWCHWCHVMDETTYRDSNVIRLINQKYIAVKVDQDSRPDISNRYEDFGWPATVVFNAGGGEIVKRQGYIEPAPMASILQAIIDDPTPGPSVRAEAEVHVASEAALNPLLRQKLADNIATLYDADQGGWFGSQKYVDADVIEYCMLQAAHGDKRLEAMARQTLTANLKLIDPVWGGVYQYSTDSDWVHPHFEKIMSYQADDLRTYSRAYAMWRDPEYLKAAQAIRGYLKNFLQARDAVSGSNTGRRSLSDSEDPGPGALMNPGLRSTSEPGVGATNQSVNDTTDAFYTSQDADRNPGEHGGEYFAKDDAGRRALGIPAIDTHIYSRENGWAIAALVAYSDATGDAEALGDAKRDAEWILNHRNIDGGGFRHGEQDAAGPYLGDTLAMGRAMLALYAATADRSWLDRAQAAAHFIGETFTHTNTGGFVTAVQHGALRSRPEVDENVAVARFMRLLFMYTGHDEEQKLAERAMKFVAAPEIADARRWAVGGILLADHELSSEPLHVTVVGKKDDATAQGLFATARSVPRGYYRVEWYDAAEGPLAKMDVQFPKLPTAAAFVCTGSSCSSPSKDVGTLKQKLEKAQGK